jgi:hypothetical protein
MSDRSAALGWTRNGCLSNQNTLTEQSERLGVIFTLKTGNRSAVPHRSAPLRNGFANNRSAVSPPYKGGNGTVGRNSSRNR